MKKMFSNARRFRSDLSEWEVSDNVTNHVDFGINTAFNYDDLPRFSLNSTWSERYPLI